MPCGHACLTRYGIAMNGSKNRKRSRDGSFRPVCELRSNLRSRSATNKNPAGWRGICLACLTRFERATYRVGVCHSIQLSYRHMRSMVIIASAGAFVNGKRDQLLKPRAAWVSNDGSVPRKAALILFLCLWSGSPGCPSAAVRRWWCCRRAARRWRPPG